MEVSSARRFVEDEYRSAPFRREKWGTCRVVGLLWGHALPTFRAATVPVQTDLVIPDNALRLLAVMDSYQDQGRRRRGHGTSCTLARAGACSRLGDRGTGGGLFAIRVHGLHLSESLPYVAFGGDVDILALRLPRRIG